MPATISAVPTTRASRAVPAADAPADGLRRLLLRGMAGAAALGACGTLTATACGAAGGARPEGDSGGYSGGDEAPVRTPAQAWRALTDGNRRWAAGRPRHPGQDGRRRRRVAPEQFPFAVVLSCIDSRVPPETVFDRGVGDLLVVRTAAHLLSGLVTASVEYGPVETRTPLVVVLGHQRCGAVRAAVAAAEHPTRLPGRLGVIAAALRPAYRAGRATSEGGHGNGAAGTTGAGGGNVGDVGDVGDIVERTVRAQILRTVRELAGDRALAGALRAGRLGLAGAYYSLDSGAVSLLSAVGFSAARH